MDTTLPFQSLDPAGVLMDEQNRRISETIVRERGRLASFIRRKVSDASEAEDILQDVFFSFVELYRMPEPIEQAGAWLFRVARHRIIDRFRKKREEPLPLVLDDGGDGSEEHWLEQALPSFDGDPETAHQRARVLEAISDALEELPVRQREVFIAHELDGMSFKELAERSGVGVNTLLGWKRQAVLHLRSRLQPIYDELSD